MRSDGRAMYAAGLISLATGLWAVSVPTTERRLFDEVARLQQQSDRPYVPFLSWSKRAGIYRSELKLYFHGPPPYPWIRDFLGIFDNNMFTTAWVTTSLLEAHVFGRGPRPSLHQNRLALRAIANFTNRNGEHFPNSVMTFWPQVHNATAGSWQSTPENLLSFFRLIDHLPWKLIEEVLSTLHLKDLVETIKGLLSMRAKLSYGLLSSTYSKPLLEEDGEYLPPPQGIRPMMFKTLIGRGHQEFSTKRQQDAQDFFLHLISVIERNSVGTYNPTECFRYKVEEKVRCIQSGKVKYSYRTDFLFSVPVPLEAAVNKAEVVAYEKKKQEFASQQLKMDPKDLVRSKIPLSACIEAFAAVETVDDFFSTALQAKSVVHKSTRFASFPDYLMVQLKKFTVGEDWAPKKLDVSIDIPDELDLGLLRGHGLQPGEEELPTDVPAEPEIQIDDAIVYQLMDMGFPLEASRRGAYYTQSNSLEAATNWVMEHMDDPDFASPFELPESQAKSSSFVPVEEYAAAIQSMGFSREQAVKALAATDNNIERAADWIFSHPEELEIGMDTGEPAAGTIASSELQYRDGAGKYKLVGFISHMGTSSMVGHYVCHIRKEDNWVIFNDEKVALSEHPPKDLAYLYLYQRI